jgi:tRNA threonylcarbamoyladenosine biosynthesis protein TsaE
MQEFILSTQADLSDAVKWVLDHSNSCRKIMLYGEMGVGKTTFAKAFCEHFGVTDWTSSPTFSLVNEYFYTEKQGNAETSQAVIREENSPSPTLKIIHHLDLYRLKNIEEALDIGIEDYLYDEYYCLIEWPYIIESLLPDENVLRISLELADNGMRRIVIL